MLIKSTVRARSSDNYFRRGCQHRFFLGKNKSSSRVKQTEIPLKASPAENSRLSNQFLSDCGAILAICRACTHTNTNTNTRAHARIDHSVDFAIILADFGARISVLRGQWRWQLTCVRRSIAAWSRAAGLLRGRFMFPVVEHLRAYWDLKLTSARQMPDNE